MQNITELDQFTHTQKEEEEERVTICVYKTSKTRRADLISTKINI